MIVGNRKCSKDSVEYVGWNEEFENSRQKRKNETPKNSWFFMNSLCTHSHAADDDDDDDDNRELCMHTTVTTYIIH